MTSEFPQEAHHYRRSQTPESPQPLHIPEPSAIPVLKNQMDPVFNDTTTYNIPAESPSASKLTNGDDHNPSTPLSQAHFSNNHAPPISNDIAEPFTLQQNSGASQIALNDAQEYQSHSANLNAHSFNANVPDLQRTLDSLAHLTDPTHIITEPIQESPYIEALARDTIRPDTDVSSTGAHAQPAPLEQEIFDATATHEIAYPPILNTVSQPTATAAVDTTNNTAAAAASTDTPANEEPASSKQSLDKPLPVGAGLPPRPPPQEKPSIHPNYSPNESIQSYHQLSPQNVNSTAFQTQSSSYQPLAAAVAGNSIPSLSATLRAANGLPPPPIASFQQVPADAITDRSPSTHAVVLRDATLDHTGSPSGRQDSQSLEDQERPWGPEIQKKYDQFLHDERVYVTEGVWDRFPPGSRLFVGNLPTEKVTKRDLFHIFHPYGKLAQISLKQAYGFVQFLEASSCYNALDKEQSVAIRGRKIHLEVSKPQKGSRNTGPADSKPGSRRRSRSPDRRSGGVDRGAYSDRLPFSDFRDEPRRRDDYRPLRSPSPRGYRNRDDYRPHARSPARYSHYDRPRSPPHSRDSNNFGSGSPRGFDDEAALPLPRRDPRDVPDVQILILQDVDQNFSRFVENGFKQKGMRAATIHLNPRITHRAVVKRQIIEGVQAVVNLDRVAQQSGRIPLQVFDRSGGATSVNFHEYVDLEVSIAADIVIQARQKERSAYPPPNVAPRQPQSYGSAQQPSYPYHQPTPQAYPQPYPPPYQAPHGQHQAPYPPQREPAYGGPNPLASNNGQNLQDLLANLRQAPQHPASGHIPSHQMPAAGGGGHDIGALLSNVARQQNQGHGPSPSQYPQVPPNTQYDHRMQAPSYGPPAGVPPYAPNPAAGMPQQGAAQNVRNIMDQLARWKQ